MGRTHITPVRQPNDVTCGPAALKTALRIFNVKKSMHTLIKLCKTNSHGTTTRNLITAVNKLGFHVLAVEYATLRHLQSALKYKPGRTRAVLVSYLSELDEKKEPHEESGHWSMVSSYATGDGRIILFDSASGKRISFRWKNFRKRWFDYDLKRRHLNTHKKKFQLVRRWQPQLMLVLSREKKNLPKFQISSLKVFPAGNA